MAEPYRPTREGDPLVFQCDYDTEEKMDIATMVGFRPAVVNKKNGSTTEKWERVIYDKYVTLRQNFNSESKKVNDPKIKVRSIDNVKYIWNSEKNETVKIKSYTVPVPINGAHKNITVIIFQSNWGHPTLYIVEDYKLLDNNTIDQIVFSTARRWWGKQWESKKKNLLTKINENAKANAIANAKVRANAIPNAKVNSNQPGPLVFICVYDTEHPIVPRRIDFPDERFGNAYTDYVELRKKWKEYIEATNPFGLDAKEIVNPDKLDNITHQLDKSKSEKIRIHRYIPPGPNNMQPDPHVIIMQPLQEVHKSGKIIWNDTDTAIYIVDDPVFSSWDKEKQKELIRSACVFWAKDGGALYKFKNPNIYAEQHSGWSKSSGGSRRSRRRKTRRTRRTRK